MKLGRCLSLLFLVASLASLVALPLTRAWTPVVHASGRSGICAREGGEELDGPGAAHRWAQKGWRDNSGTWPADGLTRALGERNRNIEFNKRFKVSSKTAGSWTSLGPTNIGGRAQSVVIDPNNASHIFVGAAGGGVWQSSDGGATWSPIDDRWLSLAIGTVAYDRNVSTTLYAGTGEWPFAADAINGAGIYRSFNNGLTWTRLASTSGFSSVSSIDVQPGNSNLLLVGVVDKNFGSGGGIYRSTDQGNSWTQVVTSMSGTEVEFADANNAVGVYFTGSAYLPVYSSNQGASWSIATGVPSVNDLDNRIVTRVSRSSPNVVYCVTGVNNTGGIGGAVYKSVDYGHTYSLVSQPGFRQAYYSWWVNPLWVDPTNPNILVSGDVYWYRSTDGGLTWSKITNGYINTVSPHPDSHGIVADPGFNGTTNKRVFVVTDGNLFRSDDIYAATIGNSNWTRLDQNNPTTQFYSVAGNAATGTIVGGLQDNGTLSLIGGSSTATLSFGGDGGFVAADQSDPNTFYGEYIYAQVHRSTNGGASSAYIYNGISEAGGAQAPFIAPFTLSPNDPNTLWVGCTTLYRSQNVKAAKPSWTGVKAGSTQVSAIAEASNNANLVWVGYDDGQLDVSTDAASASPSWGALHNFGRQINSILFDPANAQVAYVTLGGFTTGNVMKTTDGGATWTSVSGSGATGLPAAPVRCIARNPANANSLFVGTEVGVFETDDGGATWSTSDFGPANVCTYSLEWMKGSTTQLLAGTHGRGAWKYTISNGVAVSSLTSDVSSVLSGGAVTLTVNLVANALAGGQQVSLTSSPAVADLPASVTVPAGASSTQVVVHPTTSTTSTFTFTAAALGQQAQTSVNVTGPQIRDFACVPNTLVYGGRAATFRITLNAPAGFGGLTFNLSSPSALVPVPGTATVPSGSSSVDITSSLGMPLIDTGVYVTATAAGQPTKQAYIRVGTVVLSSLAANAITVPSGGTYVLTVKLNASAPVGGASVALSCSLPQVHVPSTLTVPYGQSVASVSFPVDDVDSTLSSSISGVYNSVTKSIGVTVQKAAFSSFTMGAASVYGGYTTSGLIKLSGTAGPSGVTADLLSSVPTNVVVPATVTIPPGQKQGSFTVSTIGVNTSITPNVKATIGPAAKVAYLTVLRGTALSALFTPTNVAGGAKATLVIKLSGKAGPAGTTFALSSTDPAHAPVPATVTVPAQALQAAVVINTTSPTASETVNITCTGPSGVGNLTGSFTLNP